MGLIKILFKLIVSLLLATAGVMLFKTGFHSPNSSAADIIMGLGGLSFIGALTIWQI